MNEIKAIELLRNMLPEKVSYANLVGASNCYGDKYVYEDPEPYAIELAISALEKQIPKKPKNIRNILFGGTTKPNFSDGECPNCGGYVNTDENRYVCGQSGCYQALDWSVDDE